MPCDGCEVLLGKLQDWKQAARTAWAESLAWRERVRQLEMELAAHGLPVPPPPVPKPRSA